MLGLIWTASKPKKLKSEPKKLKSEPKKLKSEPKKLKSELVLALKKSKSLIEQGWCQNTIIKIVAGKNHYCTMGAIELGSTNNEIVAKVYKIFRNANQIEREDIPNWNDSWFRTKRSVLRAFDRAIALVEKETE